MEYAFISIYDVYNNCLYYFLWGTNDFAGTMKVGELTGFLSYVMQILNSLMMISAVFLMLTRSIASCERIIEVLDEIPDISDPQNTELIVRRGDIDFHQVNFKYKEELKSMH